MMAAGRPASVLSASPHLFCSGCGQEMPRAARCVIRPRKNGRSSSRDALLIQRQDEIAGRGMQQEVGILDALGDALVGQQFADLVTCKEIRKLVGGNVGVNRHGRLRRVGPQRTRQRKELVLFRGRDRLHMQFVALGERAHDLLDDHFRRRGARGDAEALDALEIAASR